MANTLIKLEPAGGRGTSQSGTDSTHGTLAGKEAVTHPLTGASVY